MTKSGTDSYLRNVRILLRTAHIAAFSILYGGVVFGVAPERLEPALAATLATGGIFMAIEIHSSRVWLIQLRGLASLLKVGLVAIAWLAPAWRVPVLSLVLLIGSVASHMPSRFRYYSVVHRRDIGHAGDRLQGAS